MNGPTSFKPTREVYEIVRQRIIQCRAHNGEPSCGRPRGFPCWLEAFVPGHMEDPLLRTSAYCCACLRGIDVFFSRCGDEGQALARALYLAGVHPRAADMLWFMREAHDEPGNGYEAIMVDAIDTFERQRKERWL